MQSFLLAIALVSGTAHASDKCCPEKPQFCPPKAKVVYVTKTVEGKSPNTQSQAKSDATAVNSATTGNQSIIIQQPHSKPVVVKLTRTIIKRRVVKETKKVFVYKPNRLLLLGGLTKTHLDIDFDCCNLDVKRKYENDFGLQYIRDFGHVSGSVAATLNKSMYLGLGVNW